MRVKPLGAAVFTLMMVAAGCREPERLTREIAAEVVRSTMLQSEPAYAEVPQVVRWSASSPADDFDRRSIATLRRLEGLGLVTLTSSGDEREGSLTAAVTPAAARILGIVPSARGPALRGRVAVKKLDGVGRFTPHPSDPRAARVEVLWHYEAPTALHPAFSAVSDRQLHVPYATVISMSWLEGAWRGRVLIRKTRPTSPGD